MTERKSPETTSQARPANITDTHWFRPGDIQGGIFRAHPPYKEWLLSQTCYQGLSEEEQGVFGLGRCGLFVAAPGAANTKAMCGLALAVATGTPWLGKFNVEQKGKVLLCLGAEQQDDAHRMLYEAAKAANLNDEQRELASNNVVVFSLSGVFTDLVVKTAEDSLAFSNHFDDLIRFLEDNSGEEGWRLIVLDPLSRFAGVDAEINSFAATKFVQAVERLAQVKGRPSVMVTHYTTKVSRAAGEPLNINAVRGTSALADGFRWVAALSVAGERSATFQVIKSNETAEGIRLNPRS